jgi:hypothetical protein
VVDNGEILIRSNDWVVTPVYLSLARLSPRVDDLQTPLETYSTSLIFFILQAARRQFKPLRKLSNRAPPLTTYFHHCISSSFGGERSLNNRIRSRVGKAKTSYGRCVLGGFARDRTPGKEPWRGGLAQTRCFEGARLSSGCTSRSRKPDVVAL